MAAMDNIVKHLDGLKRTKPGAWVLKHDGRILTMRSRKSLWAKKNHATAALASHLSSGWHREDYTELGLGSGTELAQYLVANGIVTVEQLT